MYSIVDKRIFLLPAKLMAWCPYRYRCDLFPKWVRLYFCKIAITLIAKVALTVAKKDTKIRSDWYLQYPDYKDIYQKGCQWSYDDFCDILRNLSRLTWKMYRSPKGSCIPEMHFFFWRIKDKICFLRTLKDGISPKWVITLFQEVIASGKKLRCYYYFACTMICGRRLIIHNLMYLQNAPTPTTTR